MKQSGKQKRGLAFILSAPAGTGKTTLVEKLAKAFPLVVKNISLTTRAPRPDEIDGIHYRFVTEREFLEKIAAGELLEYVCLFGNYYGTSRKWIEQQQEEGKHVFLVIDTQGALRLKGRFKAVSIFILPPSLEELKIRLEKRRTENPEVIRERLSLAEKEMKQAGFYDYNIVNDDLEKAYQVLKSILIAEEHRVEE